MPIPPRPLPPSRIPGRSSFVPAESRQKAPAWMPADNRQAERSFELKSQVHQKLLVSLNTDQMKLISKERMRIEIGTAVESLLLQEGIPMALAERDRLI